MRGALPGDDVLVSAAGDRVLAVTRPSPDRVEPPCAHADRCGGCRLIALLPEAAFAAKVAMVRAGLPGSPRIIERPSPRVLGYRRRARFGFARGALGLHRAGSRALVDLPDCAVLTPVLAAAYRVTRERLLEHLVGEGEVSIGLGMNGAVLVVDAQTPQPSVVYDVLAELVGEGGLAGAALRCAGTEARFGDPAEWTPSSSGPLEGTVGGFAQANDEVALALAAAVTGYARAEGQRVLELHAGHGHFGVELARGAVRFTSIEFDPKSVAAARRNFARLGLHGEILVGDAAAVPAGPFDVAVLDPPRSGAKESIPGIVASGVARVVYVACDPGALFRDARLLVERGFSLVEVQVFDMFPGTSDVETVAFFVRDGAGADVAGDGPSG